MDITNTSRTRNVPVNYFNDITAGISNPLADDGLVPVQPIPHDSDVTPFQPMADEIGVTPVQPLPDNSDVTPVQPRAGETSVTPVQPLQSPAVSTEQETREHTATQPISANAPEADVTFDTTQRVIDLNAQTKSTNASAFTTISQTAPGSADALATTTALSDETLAPTETSPTTSAADLNTDVRTSPTTWEAYWMDQLGFSVPGSDTLGAQPTVGVEGGDNDIDVKAAGYQWDSVKYSDPTFKDTYHYATESKGILYTDSTNITASTETTEEYGPGQPYDHRDFYQTESIYSTYIATSSDEFITFNSEAYFYAHCPEYTSGHGIPYDYAPGVVFVGGDAGNLARGSAGDDTLIGGQGDDELHGVSGNNVLMGVAGNNALWGGDSDATSILIGGVDSDYINFSGADGFAYGNQGDNIILVGETSEGQSYDIIGGTGQNTFVLGALPMASSTTVTESTDYVSLIADNAWSIAETVGGYIPGGDIVVGVAETFYNFFDYVLSGDDSESYTYTTEAPEQNVITIYDFNPTKDKLLIPMNASGSDNIKIEWNKLGGYLEVIDETGGDSVVAKAYFAHAYEIFGIDEPLTTEQPAWFEAYIDGFIDAMVQNAVMVDGKYGAAYNGESLENNGVEFEGMSDLGTNRFALVGAWHGYTMQGVGEGSNDTHFIGTVNNDYLASYTPGDYTDPNYSPGDLVGQVFFGIDGDNIMCGGGGANTYHGGDGTDLIAYWDATEALSVDMSALETDENGEYFSFYNGFVSQEGVEHLDKAYSSIDGIIGSMNDDTLVGNDGDNTFWSTGGDNTWTGTDGENTFMMTGGTSTVTDYMSNDSIVIMSSAYYEDGETANLFWVNNGDSFTLYDAGLDTEIVTLEATDDTSDSVEVVIRFDDDTSETVIPSTQTDYDLLA